MGRQAELSIALSPATPCLHKRLENYFSIYAQFTKQISGPVLESCVPNMLAGRPTDGPTSEWLLADQVLVSRLHYTRDMLILVKFADELKLSPHSE